MTERPTLIIMAKAPRVGVGKSRLAAGVGRTEAWRINRGLHARTMGLARDARWGAVLCVTPDCATRQPISVWPSSLPRMPQGGGDLGARLARALSGRRTVAVIGTDCPQVTRGHIRQAFAALKQASFALGPACDGGFWLLAARSGDAAARAMANVRWSSEYAAEDVLRNLGARDVVLLPTLRDVDVAEDLSAYRSARR